MQGLQQAHGFTTAKLRQQHAGSKASTARFALFTAPPIRGSRDAVSREVRSVHQDRSRRPCSDRPTRPTTMASPELCLAFSPGVRSSGIGCNRRGTDSPGRGVADPADRHGAQTQAPRPSRCPRAVSPAPSAGRPRDAQTPHLAAASTRALLRVAATSCEGCHKRDLQRTGGAPTRRRTITGAPRTTRVVDAPGEAR